MRKLNLRFRPTALVPPFCKVAVSYTCSSPDVANCGARARWTRRRCLLCGLVCLRSLTCGFSLSFSATRSGAYDELRDYARKLLGSYPASVSEPNPTPALSLISANGQTEARGELSIEGDREREEDGGLSGCRQAVEILTRNPKKGEWVAWRP